MNEFLKLFIYNPAEPFLFTNGFFLFLFSLFLICYGFSASFRISRDLILIVFSAYFYYRSSGHYFVLLGVSVLLGYLIGRGLQHTKQHRMRQILLGLGLVFSLTPLLYFKYSGFLLENLNLLTGVSVPVLQLVLPIGISFYTFQTVSYLVDIYQKKIEAASLRSYTVYMTFFPHLVAGPIVRARDFIPQTLKLPQVDAKMLGLGFYLILQGFIKKSLVADQVGQYADLIFSDPGAYTSLETCLGVLCYTLQIFGDFSGYTDMAIGISLLMGFKLCINFTSPYKALNITDFWRRWHISLSTWLRDYIYIPLGGNRRGPSLQLLFLLLTMLIGGLWHGASWKFVLWGGGHGILLILHKLFLKYFFRPAQAKWLYAVLGWICTFCAVALLWVPFRAATLADAIQIYKNLGNGFSLQGLIPFMQVNTVLIGVLLSGYGAVFFPQTLKDHVKDYFLSSPLLVKIIILLLVVQLSIQIKSSLVQPFVYFQF